MKDDRAVIAVYSEFKDKLLRELNIAQSAEEAVLNSNVAKTDDEKKMAIYAVYDNFDIIVMRAWESIYKDSEHLRASVENSDVMHKGKSIYAKTEIQKYVEQFFVSLHTAIAVTLMFYCDFIPEKQMVSEYNESIAAMNFMMDQLSPFFLTEQERKKDEYTEFVISDMYSNIEFGQKQNSEVWQKRKEAALKGEPFSSIIASEISSFELQSKKSLKDKLMEQIDIYLDKAYEEFDRLELEYEKYSKSGIIDYSRFAADWYSLHKLSESGKAAIMCIIENIEPDYKNIVLGKLISLKTIYRLLSLYSIFMSKVASRLDIRSRGGDYPEEDYVNELKQANEIMVEFENAHNTFILGLKELE